MNTPYRLIGGNPSPYSIKMRAVLRYRRIPFIWERRGDKHASELAHVRPPTMPYLVYPDGTVRNDSTLLIDDLEQRHTGRSLFSGDAARDFISYLLEDCADEWGTRIMAFYRWNFIDDQDFCSQWVAEEVSVGKPRAEREARAAAFRTRQVDRRMVLGATPASEAILTSSYRRVLDAFHEMLSTDEYLFGSRPSLADFGWFGQLAQMTVDPTASQIMRKDAPDVYAWLLRLDDASGVEGEWQPPEKPLRAAVHALLRMALEIHVPLLVANAAAVAADEVVCKVTLLGKPYEQATNKYHVKLLTWLKERYESLEPAAQRRVDEHIRDAGGSPLFGEH